MRNYGRNRRDTVEPEVVKALQQCGWKVMRLSVKNGPDLACSRAGWTVLVEVKTGKKKLQPGQATWQDGWLGACCVLRTAEDAVRMRSDGRIL